MHKGSLVARRLREMEQDYRAAYAGPDWHEKMWPEGDDEP